MRARSRGWVQAVIPLSKLLSRARRAGEWHGRSLASNQGGAQNGAKETHASAKAEGRWGGTEAPAEQQAAATHESSSMHRACQAISRVLKLRAVQATATMSTSSEQSCR